MTNQKPVIEIKRQVNSTVGPGVTYIKKYATINELKEAILHFEVDLTNPYITPLVMSPHGRVGELTTLENIAKYLEEQGEKVIFGVNGDFFNYLGVPEGLQITDGEIFTTPHENKLVMMIDKYNKAHFLENVHVHIWLENEMGELLQVDGINRVRSEDDEDHLFIYNYRFQYVNELSKEGHYKIISFDERPSFHLMTEMVGHVNRDVTMNDFDQTKDILITSSGKRTREFVNFCENAQSIKVCIKLNKEVKSPKVALCANGEHGELLIKDKQINKSIITSDRTVNLERHPRTIVGSKDGFLQVVVFDGRQPGYSDGVTLAEAAYYLQQLQFDVALNVDGGGSTTCHLRDVGSLQTSLANRPSDQFERGIGNGLFFLNTSPVTTLKQLINCKESPIKVAYNSSYSFELTGIDEHFNPKTINPDDIEWSLKSEHQIGSISNEGLFTSGCLAGEAIVQATYRGVNATFNISVTNDIRRLVFDRSSYIVQPMSEYTFNVAAFDEHDDEVFVSPEQLLWSVQGGIGKISDDGILITDSSPKHGKVSVQYYGNVRAEVYVTVGRPPMLIEDFEDIAGLQGSRDNVADSFVLTKVPRPLPVRFGTFSAKVDYSFTDEYDQITMDFLSKDKTIGRKLIETPYRLSLWVHSDMNNHSLVLRLLDRNGTKHILPFTESGGMDWLGWKYVYVSISPDLGPELTITSIAIVKAKSPVKYNGSIFFDHFKAEYVHTFEDVTGPELHILHPKKGFKYDEKTQIVATIIDEESGVDVNSIRLYINNVQVNHSFDQSNNKLTYITEMLPKGENEIIIVATDMVGNPSIIKSHILFE